MKALAYVFVAAGFGWAAFLASAEAAERVVAAPAAALMGTGFGKLTAHSVRAGSVRGVQGRIRRDEHPTAFWLAIFVRAVVSFSLIAGAVLLWTAD